MGISTHEARIHGLEARVAKAEEDAVAIAVTDYNRDRRLVRVEITLDKLADHFGIDRASDAEVEERLDAG